MTRIVRAFAALILVGSLLGCSTVQYGGAPKPSFNVNKDLEQLAKEFGDAVTIKEFYENPSKEARNKFIAGRLVMMDIRYIQFIRKCTSEKQLLDSAVDILALSLNLAGATVDSAGTKTVLAAIAAGVTGAKTTIDKNYYFERTVPALIAAMNAERKKALYPILDGTNKNLAMYPFERAVTDLHNYYVAGTFIGAIQAIHADATHKERVQEESIRKLSRVTEADVAAKASLTDAIRELRETDLAKAAQLLKRLDPEGTNPPENIEEAKDRLQSYVRKADPKRTSELVGLFKEETIM